MKRLKKILAVVLSLMMIMSLMIVSPVGVSAVETGGSLPGTFVLVHDKGDIGTFNADGSITYTAAADDYVWIRNYDTGVQYCTDGWQGFVSSTTLVNEKNTKQFNKLYVAAGTQTLKLVCNGDDTFTLSYGGGESTIPHTTSPKPTSPQPTQQSGTLNGNFVLVHNTGDIGTFDSNGKITYTATEDDYVWVRNYDTGVQYCTDGWQGFVESVTLVNEKTTKQFNKLYVPAGTQTLTLVDNGDDTFTLSYGDVKPTEPQPTTGTTQPVTYITVPQSTTESTTQVTEPKPTEPQPTTQQSGTLNGNFVLVHNTGDIGTFDSNGKITYTATEDDYVWVRNYDTGVQYCTDGWQGFVESVTLVNEKTTKQFNKLCVPTGTQTLTLVDNGDDTFTLSYGAVKPTEPTPTTGTTQPVTYTTVPQSTTESTTQVTEPKPTEPQPTTQQSGTLNGNFVLVHDNGDIGTFDSNGTLTYTADENDYVWVRNYDTGVQYCTDGWQGFVESVTLVNEKVTKQFNKLCVPAGTQTLTLVDNGDDTFTLSYGAVKPTEPTPTNPQPTDPIEDNKLNFVVLGDSIAAGHGISSSADIYANIIADTMSYALQNLAVGGHESADLLKLIKEDSKVVNDVENADVISISIGGNDFLHNLNEIITSLTVNGADSQYVKNVIVNFSNNLNGIIAEIKKLNPDAVVILQTVYNPLVIRNVFEIADLPQFAQAYTVFNQVFYSVAEQNQNVYVADVYTAFANDYAQNKNSEIIQADGIHPSESGHKIISDVLLGKINDLVAQGIIQDKNDDTISYIVGDANGDGLIDIRDASIIQKHVAGVVTLTGTNFLAADANGNGEINISDATLIQKYLADRDTSSEINQKKTVKK